MSLLLKALKQAEADHGGQPLPPDDLELEALPAPQGKPGRDWVEPPNLLFGSGGLPPAPGRKRSLRWPRLSLVPLTALVATVIALGYGVYLYFELQPPSAPPLRVPPAAPASPAPPAPITVQPAAPQQPTAPAPAPAAIAPPAEPKPGPEAAQAVAAGRPAAPRAAAAASPAAPSAGETAGSAPRFQPNAHAALLNDAYAAYQRGQLAEAERLYAEAAARQRSTDALLGLAAIAASLDRDSDAVRLYREVLERDPRNADAQAALLDLLGNTDSQAAESRLKILIGRQPSPHLYQTLGNLYADQQRWVEAQPAYFEAYRAAPDNADYAYNLAVSLDQLRQPAAALTYYERALAAGGAHRFDRAQAEERVRQLKALP